MADVERLLALTVASVVVIAVPGPSVLFVVGRSLAHGRRVALLSVLGNAAGAYSASAVIALGLGPLLQNSQGLLTAVRLAGALYLVWLGVQALRTRSGLGAADLGSGPGGSGPGGTGPATGHVVAGGTSAWGVVRQGVWVGLLNPKVLLFFSAFLPQFVTPTGPPVPVQLLLLALVPVAVGLVMDSLWGLGAARLRSWFGTDPRRLTWANRTGGALMLGLGGSLAVDTAAR